MFGVSKAATVVAACAGREPPSGMQRAQHCVITNDGSSYRTDIDCTSYESLFNRPYPGTTGLRFFAMDSNRYVSLEMTPTGISPTQKTLFNIEAFQGDKNYLGNPIMVHLKFGLCQHALAILTKHLLRKNLVLDVFKANPLLDFVWADHRLEMTSTGAL